VRNFLPVSLTPVKLSKTVKVSLTGVNGSTKIIEYLRIFEKNQNHY
jgi:hypothetical protein